MITTGEKLRGVSGIYCAIHRESLRCYVGSSVNIGQRLIGHLSAARSGETSAFYNAIREYGPEAFDFEVLERCEKHQILDRERFYIAFLNAASLDGFNTVADPKKINYGLSPSPVTRERLRQVNLGKKRTQQARLNMSKARKGEKKHPNVIAALRLANTGRKHTEEHIQKRVEKIRGCKKTAEAKAAISKANSGRVFTPEHRAKLAAAKLGRKASDETRAKMSATRAGRKRAPFSPEWIAAMSRAHVGKKLPPEQVAKMKESRARTLAKKKTQRDLFDTP